MSPRKKSKPNPKADADNNSTGPEAPAESSGSAAASASGTPNDSEVLQDVPSSKSLADSTATSASNGTASGEQAVNKKGSRKWLGGSGSWRSKAPAMVKTAKETIGVSGGATSELPAEEAKKPKDQSPTKFLTKRKSSKGDAIPASMTKLNVSSDGPIDQAQEANPDEPPKEQPPPPNADEPPLPPDPAKKNEPKETAGTWGWRSWWSRPDGFSESGKDSTPGTDAAQTTPLPGPTPSEEADQATKELGNTKGQDDSQNQDTEMKDAPAVTPQDEDTEMKDAPSKEMPSKNASTSSWFWLWSSTQNVQTNPPKPAPAGSDSATKPDVAEPAAETQQPQEPVAVPEPPSTASDGAEPKELPKSSGWAFWYRDKPKTEDKPAEGASQKHIGEVAVSDTPSQSRPEPAQFNEQEQPKPDAIKEPTQPAVEETEPAPKKSFRSLRGRRKAKGAQTDTPADTPSSSKAATPSKTSPERSPTRQETAPAAQPAPKQATKALEPPNLILPEFTSTYQLVQQPSFWQQIRQYFLGGEAAMPHLHINPAPPRVKKAVAIGIHGYFPAPIFQKVIGQPKGTSIRFANAAAAAIKDWCEGRGYTPEIEQIALEGEGFIADRVKTLWKLMLNWIEHIKAADFILVACHSQGVPVAIMLVAKLIQFGCVNATRIGVCAMAGVNMGPFIEYKTKYFGPTAAELFEFSNPKSLVSQMYLAGLDEVLRFGVRILYVGSIDDQLVSLEVSSSLSHCITAY